MACFSRGVNGDFRCDRCVKFPVIPTFRRDLVARSKPPCLALTRHFEAEYFANT